VIQSYKEDLLKALKESALLIAESEKYNNLYSDYKEVKKLLDEKLTSIKGAYIKNSESYIDIKSGKFIPPSDIESSLDSQTKFMFSRFALLAKQLKNARWKDETSHSVDVILSLSKAKNLQKELINKYGKCEAENFINTVILEMEDFEKEHKINVYTKEIFFIKEKNKIKCLRPINAIEVTSSDNVINSTVELFNDFHQSFLMKKR
jgi:formyltetrahydrofolate hydrolase